MKIRRSVYPPSEDTWLLMDNIPQGRGLALEIGSGTGVISLDMLEKGWDVISIDVNLDATINTLENYKDRDNKSYFQIINTDLLNSFKPNLKIDLLVFNFPYIPTLKKKDIMDLSWNGGLNGRETIDQFIIQLERNEVKIKEMLLVQSRSSNPLETKNKLKLIGYDVIFKDKKPDFFDEIVIINAKNKEN